MPRCLIYYATSQGQTGKIAEHVAKRLRENGVEVEVHEAHERVDLSQYDAVVIGDSIRIGRHHRRMLEFIAKHRERLAAMPSAFFSVCLAVTSEREEDRVQARGYVDQMSKRTGWRPEQVAVFAGALQYSKYGLLTRFIMKKIAAAEGHETDTSRDYEFTDWGSVSEFADSFAQRLTGATLGATAG